MDAVSGFGLKDLIDPVVLGDMQVAIGPAFVPTLGVYVVGACDRHGFYAMTAQLARERAQTYRDAIQCDQAMDGVISALIQAADTVEFIGNVQPVGSA